MAKTVAVKIKRQRSSKDSPYWETFQFPYQDGENLIALLSEIRKNSITSEGKPTTPVAGIAPAWKRCVGPEHDHQRSSPAGVQRACECLEAPIMLEPLSKFPVIKDLMVDRTALFEKSKKKVKAWIPIDGTYPAGAGPRLAERDRSWAYDISRWMSCGCCMEACPNTTICLRSWARRLLHRCDCSTPIRRGK